MNDEMTKKIEQIAYDYLAVNVQKFAIRKITSIQEQFDYNEFHETRFLVKMTLAHSVEEIEELVSEAEPEEANITREFLNGDFTATLIVSNEKVVSMNWENIDIC